MQNSKEELIVNIELALHTCNDLNVDVSLLNPIAKHLSKMPKRTRIPFIKALITVIEKASEYDHIQSLSDPDWQRSVELLFKNPEWNK